MLPGGRPQPSAQETPMLGSALARALKRIIIIHHARCRNEPLIKA
jgi:hypothetical protein